MGMIGFDGRMRRLKSGRGCKETRKTPYKQISANLFKSFVRQPALAFA